MDSATGNNENSKNFLSPTESLHPLEHFLILATLFEYLEKDKKNIRLVCSYWDDCTNNDRNSSLPIKINDEPSRSFRAFRELLNHPLATLKCRHIILERDSDFTNSETMSILEAYGDEIRKMIIKPALNQLSILTLLHYCHNLRHLDMDSGLVTSLKIPQHFQDTWNDPLPNLMSLTIKSQKYTTEYESFNANNFPYHSQFEFIVLLLSKAFNLETFKIMDYPIKIWEQLSNQFILRPEISSKVKRIHLNFGYNDTLSNTQLCSIYQPKFNLKILEIQRLAHDVTTEEFSKLLKHYSTSLETLTIYKINLDNSFDYNDFIRLRDSLMSMDKDLMLDFPCTMTKLKNLSIYSAYKYKISCTSTTPGNMCVFNLLPNLKIYRAKGWALGLDIGVQVGEEIDHWGRLFSPSLKPDTIRIVQNALLEIDSVWCIKSFDIVHEIQKHLPQLLKVSLKVEGSVLTEIADVMSRSQVRELSINYLETAEGVDQFASGITGVSISDCKEYGTGNGNEMKKIRQSFVDWKALRKLTFLYTRLPPAMAGRDFMPLTDACATYGFATWKQLESLTLMSFSINQRQIEETLKTNSLKVFDLTKSVVDIWNSSNEICLFGMKLSHSSLMRSSYQLGEL